MSDTVDSSIAPLAKVMELTTADTEFGHIINSIGLCDEVIRRAREIKGVIEDIAIEKLRATGPQRIGTTRFWAGPSKTYKCRDVRKTLEDMLAYFDMDTINDCLSSSAIKHGAFRKAAEAAMPGMFDAHFETVEKWELKDGKDTPKLQKLDTAFLR